MRSTLFLITLVAAAAVVALSGIAIVQGALIPGFPGAAAGLDDDHRIPNFENTIQNNASTIVVNGDGQRVHTIAERTYTVPGTGKQIIFMSVDDYERFKNSLPHGFRVQTRTEQPPQPPPRAEPYNSVPNPGYEGYSSPEENGTPSQNMILSSGSRNWDSSSAWTPPPAPQARVPAPQQQRHYNYRYASGAQIESIQIPPPPPAWPASTTSAPEHREPYENMLQLHRNGQFQNYNQDSEPIPAHLLSPPRDQLDQPSFYPSRLQSPDDNHRDTEVEVRTDAYGNDYPPGYRRYSDYALGGAGQEYRTQPPPASASAPGQSAYYPPPPEQPPEQSITYPPPSATYTPPTPTESSYYYPSTPATANGNGNGKGVGARKPSRCCVITYTCVIVYDYKNGDRRHASQKRRICTPKMTAATTTTTTPRPNDAANGGGGRSRCCCCYYVCC